MLLVTAVLIGTNWRGGSVAVSCPSSLCPSAGEHVFLLAERGREQGGGSEGGREGEREGGKGEKEGGRNKGGREGENEGENEGGGRRE